MIDAKNNLMRKTKTFSFDAREDKWFKRLKREARASKPRVTESALLVDIIKEHFERKRMVEELNAVSDQ